jgi:hypothetical protein
MALGCDVVVGMKAALSLLGERLLDGIDVPAAPEEASSTLAERAAAWRRELDAQWTGDGCAHAEIDLLGTCRRCGANAERAS